MNTIKVVVYRLFFVLFLLVGLSACQSTEPEQVEPPQYSVMGEWHYAMVSEADGNTYDEGTIIFEGEGTAGTYRMINIYEVAYEGSYTVSGAAVTLSGAEEWQGSFADGDHLKGSWQHKDEDVGGSWTAERR